MALVHSCHILNILGTFMSHYDAVLVLFRVLFYWISVWLFSFSSTFSTPILWSLDMPVFKLMFCHICSHWILWITLCTLRILCYFISAKHQSLPFQVTFLFAWFGFYTLTFLKTEKYVGKETWLDIVTQGTIAGGPCLCFRCWGTWLPLHSGWHLLSGPWLR